MQTSHEDASGWCADGAAAVVAGEAYALLGKLVDVWSRKAPLSEAGDVTVAKVIREEEDDVWAAVLA